MKPLTCLLTLCLSASWVHGEAETPISFTSTSGREFTNVTVAKVEKDEVILKTSSALIRLHIGEIPKAVREQLGMDVSELLNATSLDELKPILEAELEEDRSAVINFQATYENHLKALSAESQEKGDLERLLVIKQELETFREGKPRDYSGFHQLHKLRSIYETNYPTVAARTAKEQTKTRRLYLWKLSELKKLYTKAGELDQALAVAEEEKKTLAAITQELPRAAVRTSEPEEELAWELQSSDDYVVHGRCQVTEERGLFKLKGPDHHRIATTESFTPPFRIEMKAGTESTNVRLYYGRARHNLFAIFHWQEVPTELHFYDPTTGQRTEHPGKGDLDPGNLHDIAITVGEREIVLTVDGQERLRKEGDFEGIQDAFGVGPGAGSTVLLKHLRIYRPKF